MATRIRLTLDPVTGELSNPGTTKVDKNERIIWLRDHPRIEWFSIAGKVPGQLHPFYDLNLNRRFRLPVRVLNRIPDNFTWEYLIKYKLDTEDTPRILDPKIAVKSGRRMGLSVMMSIILGGAAIAGIRYFRKMKIKG